MRDATLHALGREVKPVRAAVIVFVVGVALTGAAVWGSWRSNQHNEDRLLQIQARQAASVIGAAVAGIVQPLPTALRVAAETSGSPASFEHAMAPSVGEGKTFVSASLLAADGFQTLATTGAAPALDLQSRAGREFLSHAAASSTFVVTGIPRGHPRHIGYAMRSGPYVVYTERAIPANRRVAVESDSAFADLRFATYLGRRIRSADLATTDQTPSELPLHGRVTTATIPFGDTVITLVAKADGHLGGTLGWRLPWIILVVGLMISTVAAVITEQFVRRRRRAEADADTIASLYEEVNSLYGEQRSIAAALQKALLPRSNPDIGRLEIASRYVGGTQGIDIGGDWYSIIAIDDQHFGFVVGDVMGRGIDAAAIMARLRYTVRAYLLEGHPPEVALAMTGEQLDIIADGHFATLLVGLGELDTGRVSIANAGHLDALLLVDGSANYVHTEVGAALGLAQDASYRATTVQLEPGAALLLFTDGLVERRGENLDVGLARLRTVAADSSRPLDELVDHLLGEMIGDGVEDDVAILGFRWLPQPASLPIS
jgi:serine phosphatase RsbU (regulator of sigma subunit)